MRRLIFVTGNAIKMAEASAAFTLYGVALEQREIDIDEIQHHDPLKITEAKVRTAYNILRRPLIVNDGSWSIPALNGFPGGYMKDINRWFTPEDFLNLMASKSDRSIILEDVTAYFDGVEYYTIQKRYTGTFVQDVRGIEHTLGLPMRAVVAMDGDGGRTISQVFADRQDGEVPEDIDKYTHWKEMAEWYVRWANT